MSGMSAGEVQELLSTVQIDEERFVGLLTKLIDNVTTLQNNPSQNMVPKEDNASDHVLELLKPYTTENGGPLEVERVHFTPGRGNVIIKYPGTGDKTVTFLGSHLDVVPANPETWEVDPFHLTRDGDKLYGRGTTDCLGHVAMITDLMVELATKRPALSRTVLAIFIANEENGEIEGVGVDGLHSSGKLDELGIGKGPIFWVDSADSQPCVGTVGNMQWMIKANGKLFHSGLPHMAINPIEMVMEAVAMVQKRFYEDYPPHPDEKKYNYKCSSTMKPTQVQVNPPYPTLLPLLSDYPLSLAPPTIGTDTAALQTRNKKQPQCASGSINQIPPHATVSGDCRVTPFYGVDKVQESIEKYVAEINADPSILPSRGAFSKYVLPAEGRQGTIELTWVTKGEDGIACNLESEGADALNGATATVIGQSAPYAISGSLPLVRWLQDQGYDVQICGYGLSSRYHAENEYCSLEAMGNAVKILAGTVARLEKT
ncbi:unnamed protein product [Ectocarpus sp. 8 AP-2014]